MHIVVNPLGSQTCTVTLYTSVWF